MPPRSSRRPALALLLPALALLGSCADLKRSSVGSSIDALFRPTPAPALSPSADPLPVGGRIAPETAVGTGAYAAGLPAAAPVRSDSEGVTLNFVGADLRSVVQAVLGDTLGLAYSIDPKVQGSITLQTSGQVPRDALLTTLEDVLRLNGAALIRQPQGYRIVPAEEARFAYGMTQVGTARGPGWRTQIVPLRFANAADVQQSLATMTANGAAVRADPARNVIVMTGSGPEIAAMLDTIAALDVDVLRGQSFALHRLQIAEPKALAAELTSIFQSAGDSVRFVPVLRINALMVVARQPQNLHDAATWIERLDRPGDSNEPRLFVYRVESGRAAYLAEMLSKLYPEHGVGRAGQERYPGGEQRSGGTASTASLRAGGGGFDPGNPTPNGMTATISTAPSPAADPASGATAPNLPPPPAAANDQPTDALHGEQRPGEAQGSGVRIIADTLNNTLVVLARPAIYRQIETTIRKLDVLPAQVLIEATIAEVRLNDQLRFGTQLFFQGNNNLRLTASALGSVVPTAPGLSYFFNTNNTRVVLDTLKAITDVNVLSTPTVMVMDNQTATLQVGDQVPIITSTAQSVQQPDAPLVSQITLKDTGVILSVTPRVTASGMVQIEVRQEVSDVVNTTTSTINSPSFQRRRLESSIAVGDSETIALGGLIRTNRSRGRSGVPELVDVPVLGALFGTRTDQVDRTELLVLITPRIIRTGADARAATEELRQRLQGNPAPAPAILP